MSKDMPADRAGRESREGAESSALQLKFHESRAARHFGKSESFWTHHIRRMEDLLATHREQWSGRSGGDEPPHLVFAILGGRGSGKSSVIRTLTKRLEEGRSERDLERFGPVWILPAIDPTILAPEDNFLHAFVTNVLDELEAEAERRRKPLHELKCRTSLQKMAEHLWVVGGTPPQEEERVAAAMERLDRHRSGPLLQELIREFLFDVGEDFGRFDRGSPDESATLILPVDDPDMAFDQLTKTLEIYRRYLRHPLLVPIFGFSRQLAKKLVSQKFAEEMGYVRRARADETEAPEDVQKLTLHYFDKLLPPRTRITLELPEDALLAAEYTPPGSEESRSVSELLQEGRELAFGAASSLQDWAASRLLPGSLRRQLQLFDGLVEAKEAGAGSRFGRAADALVESHVSTLVNAGIDIEDLRTESLHSRDRLLLRQVAALGDEGFRRLTAWESTQAENLLLSLLGVLIHRPRGANEGVESEPRRENDSAAEEAGGERDSVTGLGLLAWFLALTLDFHLPIRTLKAISGRESESVADGDGTTSGDQQNGTVGARRDGVGRLTTRRSWLGPISEVRRKTSFPGLFFLHPGGHIFLHGGSAEGARVPFDATTLVRSPAHVDLWKGYACRPWLEARLGATRHRDIPALPGLAGASKMASSKMELLLRIWCPHGRRPFPWAALSLWRGLDLLKRAVDRYQEEGESADAAYLVELCKEHVGSTSVEFSIAGFEKSAAAVTGEAVSWESNLSKGLEDEIGRFADKLHTWLGEVAPQMVELDRALALLHGREMSGKFLRRIAEPFNRRPPHEWGAGSILELWSRELYDYWASADRAETRAGRSSDDEATPAGEAAAFSLAKGLARCPLFPFEPVAEGAASLETNYWQDAAFSVKVDEHQIGERDQPIPVGSLKGRLNALIPADYEAYFDLARSRQPSFKVKLSELV